jgi:hypothetical protein
MCVEDSFFAKHLGRHTGRLDPSINCFPIYLLRQSVIDMSNPNPIPLDAYRHLQEWVDTRGTDNAQSVPYKYPEIPEPPPFARFSKPLNQATIGVITSAGLYIEGQQSAFNAASVFGDASIRLIPSETPFSSLRIAHDHYDHTVPEQDLSTVNPMRNLEALVTQGFLGGIFSPQISFSGYIPNWNDVLDQLVPATLSVLKPAIEAGQLDGVLLVPV